MIKQEYLIRGMEIWDDNGFVRNGRRAGGPSEGETKISGEETVEEFIERMGEKINILQTVVSVQYGTDREKKFSYHNQGINFCIILYMED